jgi:hypothetical protein
MLADLPRHLLQPLSGRDGADFGVEQMTLLRGAGGLLNARMAASTSGGSARKKIDTRRRSRATSRRNCAFRGLTLAFAPLLDKRPGTCRSSASSTSLTPARSIAHADTSPLIDT